VLPRRGGSASPPDSERSAWHCRPV
jgi:hypothetical protein